MTVQGAWKILAIAAGIYFAAAVLSDYYEFISPIKAWTVIPVVASSLYIFWLKRQETRK